MVTDQFGNPISGLPVAFNVMENNSGGSGLLLTSSRTTDALGQAINYYTTGTTSGVQDTITAVTGNSGYNSSATVVITVNP
jgi:hypothetical protein